MPVNTPPQCCATSCRRARLARDARFDGLFFVAVKTTGIYCRPVCPAQPSKETNVRYYPSALMASQHGFRPCLRCRPESAPDSPAWRGTDTTLKRAMALIDAGEWQGQSLAEFCQRLGVGDRYLRQLFRKGLGTSPQRYRNFRRLMLAKQLLHNSGMAIGEVATAVGFGSVRRFNAAFYQLMQMPPGQLRRQGSRREQVSHVGLQLFLNYRPPYAWPWLQRFFAKRVINGLEQVCANSYRRTLQLPLGSAAFVARHCADKQGFAVTLQLQDSRDIACAIATIRRLLDLDADRTAIDQQLCSCPAMASNYLPGVPLPGMPTAFEAGVRAILGQQVSVVAAGKLVTSLVEKLGAQLPSGERLFPTPEAVANDTLECLKMPTGRRDTLKRFAAFVCQNPDALPVDWLTIKGIGPWTVDYASMRLGNPDIWLGSDLGVKKGLAILEGEHIDPDNWRPWRSYASLQMWQRLESQEQ